MLVQPSIHNQSLLLLTLTVLRCHVKIIYVKKKLAWHYIHENKNFNCVK